MTVNFLLTTCDIRVRPLWNGYLKLIQPFSNNFLLLPIMPVSVWRFRFRNAEIRFNTGNIKLFFQNRELQIMRKLDHCNIVRLRWFFYSSGEKVNYSLSYWYLKKDVMRFWDRCLNIAMSFCISWIEPAKGRLFHVVCWTAYVGVRTLIALIQ